jgi:hypothetical protein
VSLVRKPGRWRKVATDKDEGQWADGRSAVRLRDAPRDLAPEERALVDRLVGRVDDPPIRRGFRASSRPDRRYLELYLIAHLLGGDKHLGRRQLARRAGVSLKVAALALRHGPTLARVAFPDGYVD